MSAGGAVASGHGYSERRLRLLSVVTWERERRGKGGPERVREGRGAAWRSSRAVQEEPGRQGGRRWRSEGARAASTRSASYWRWVEDNLAPGGLGWPTGPARWALVGVG